MRRRVQGGWLIIGIAALGATILGGGEARAALTGITITGGSSRGAVTRLTMTRPR
jgi:hypothetical protein